jgi:hypothetical protein
MAIGKFRCIVMNVTDLEGGEISGPPSPDSLSVSVESDIRPVTHGLAILRVIRSCFNWCQKIIRLPPITPT